MNHFKENSDAPNRPRSRRTPAPRPEISTTDTPYRITAVENPQEYEAVRQAVHQDLAPQNAFHALVADQIAGDAWFAQRLAVLHAQSLSFEIEKHFDELLTQYPNADASMHTIFAWNRLQASAAQRNAITDQTPVTNRFLALYRCFGPARQRR